MPSSPKETFTLHVMKEIFFIILTCYHHFVRKVRIKFISYECIIYSMKRKSICTETKLCYEYIIETENCYIRESDAVVFVHIPQYLVFLLLLC